MVTAAIMFVLSLGALTLSLLETAACMKRRRSR